MPWPKPAAVYICIIVTLGEGKSLIGLIQKLYFFEKILSLSKPFLFCDVYNTENRFMMLG